MTPPQTLALRQGQPQAPGAGAFFPTPHVGPRVALLLLLLLLLAACSRPGSDPDRPTPANQPATQARLTTEGSGLYVVSDATLASLGWRDQEAFALSMNGEPFPSQYRDGNLYFYVPEDDQIQYGQGQTLWLRPGQPMPVAGAEATVPLESLDAIRTQSGHDFYNPKFDDDPWFWMQFFWTDSQTIEIATPGRLAGDVTVTIEVAGTTEIAHQMTVTVGDTALGTMAWDGNIRYEESFTVSADAGESLSVTLAVPDTQGDVSLLEALTVAYASAPRMVEGSFTGRSVQAGVAVFDSSRPLGWQLTPTMAALPGSESGGVLVPADGEIVITDSSIAQPASAEAVDETALPTAGADYIAVVAPSLRQSLEPLLAFHQQQGLSIATFTPQQVYDAYSFGQVDPLAIRAMLQDARDSWTVKPRFVLLVGDSTYDPAGFQAPRPEAYVPSPFIDTVFGGETVSDNVIADLDEDGYPDVALGRLPARTPAQLTTIVNKITSYSTAPADGEWRKRVLLTADGQEPLFQHNSELLRDSIPAGVTVEAIYPEANSDALAQLLPKLDESAMLVNYVGHGSVQQWGRDQILTTKAVTDQLNNGNRLPIVINMTCLTGLFSHPTQEALAETMLWSEKGGAIAAVAPSSLTLPNEQTAFNNTLMSELLSPERPTLGEAMITAKRAVALTGPTAHDIVATFNLLGDPALRPAPMP